MAGQWAEGSGVLMCVDQEQLARDARAWLTVRVGDMPLVPEICRKRKPAEIVALALSELSLLSAIRNRSTFGATRRFLVN